MLNIVVFGAPCSGKGTQSEIIAEKYELVHISTGELFRNEIKKASKLGLLVKGFIDKGELVPDGIVLKEIYRTATRRKNSSGFVFDGFPRTIQQAQTLDKSFKNKGLNIDMVIYIDVDEPELINRLLNRSKDSDRSDDSLIIIKKRIEIYEQQTIPLINYYLEQQKLITVSGMASVEDVNQRIMRAIENYIHK